MTKSQIEWLRGNDGKPGQVWNPVVGCREKTEGCRNCWARELHDMRHKAYLQGRKMPEQYAMPFHQVQLHPERLDWPLHWRKPAKVFVSSMGDLFTRMCRWSSS